MQIYIFLLSSTALLSLMVKSCASANDEALPSIFHQRIKRQAEYANETSDEDITYTVINADEYDEFCFSMFSDTFEACGGMVEGAKKLINFPFVSMLMKCNRSEPQGGDWCYSLEGVAALCQAEGPRAACLADLSYQKRCGGLSSPFAYAEHLCSTQGLILASAAMTSPCFGENWLEREDAQQRVRNCVRTGNHDFEKLGSSCSVREQYGKCMSDMIRDTCGAAFGALGVLYVDASMAMFNSAAGAVQC